MSIIPTVSTVIFILSFKNSSVSLRATLSSTWGSTKCLSKFLTNRRITKIPPGNPRCVVLTDYYYGYLTQLDRSVITGAC